METKTQHNTDKKRSLPMQTFAHSLILEICSLKNTKPELPLGLIYKRIADYQLHQNGEHGIQTNLCIGWRKKAQVAFAFLVTLTNQRDYIWRIRGNLPVDNVRAFFHNEQKLVEVLVGSQE